MQFLFPWTSRDERQNEIMRARREKEKSQHAAVHARSIQRELNQIMAENHFAARIAEQIIRHDRERA
jgi:hypothetical protein